MSKYGLKRGLCIGLISLFFLAGLVFWLFDLQIDPPMYYSGLGQSFSTDPAHYVYHARNQIVFDDFDPFNDPRWTVFQHSIVSGLSYLIFSAYEVSYEYANVTGVLLAAFGLLFFIIGMYDKTRPWITLLFTILAFGNMTLYVYGRLPFLENGLIFYTGLLFLFHSRWPEKSWSYIVSGVIVALATLTGKLFGLLLLPAVLLSLYLSSAEKQWRPLLWLGGSFTVSFVVIAFILHGGNVSYAFGYLSEQSVGIRGFPEGLKTPWGFFEHLIGFGAENRLYYINYELVVFLTAGLVVISTRLRQGLSFTTLPNTIRFPLLLTGIGLLALMPLNYSPLRYAIFLIPGSLILFTGMFAFLNHSKKYEKKRKYPLAIMLMVYWIFIAHTVIILFFKNNLPLATICWSALPGAVLLTYLTDRFLKLSKPQSQKIAVLFLVLIVIGGLSLNFYRYTEPRYATRNFTISEASADLGMILGDNAVLTGAYGPVLAMGNDKLKAYIHQFTLLEQPPGLFNSIPVTHVVISEPERKKALALYPKLKEALIVTSYWVRDMSVSVYYIGNVFPNTQTAKYQPTRYEQAVHYVHNNQVDSAYLAIGYFLNEETSSKSANLLTAQIFLRMGEHEAAMQIINTLVAKHPTDSYLILECARITQFISNLLKSQELYVLAQKYYEQGVKVNPFRFAYARQLFENVQKQFGTP